MARNDGPVLVPPAASHGVKIRAADAARDDLDVNIAVAEGLGLELYRGATVSMCRRAQNAVWRAAPYLVPLGRLPLVGRVDGEALEGVRIHSDDGELVQSSGYVVLHLRLASEV